MKVMVIVKATKDSEAGAMPSQEVLTKMGQFNEELVKAGILLAGEGLHPTSKGVRIRFPEGTVLDVPFTETKELIAGFGSGRSNRCRRRSTGCSEAPSGNSRRARSRSAPYSRPTISAKPSRPSCASRRHASWRRRPGTGTDTSRRKAAV